MPERFEKEFKILLTIAGSVIYVIGVNFFLTPLNLYSGGLIGVSQLIRTLIVKATGWDVNIDLAGIVFYVINIPIFILGFKQLAKPIVFRTLFCATLVTVLMAFVPVPKTPVLDEKSANCLVAGVLSGIGIGMVFYSSSSMGGLDLISLMVIQKNPNFSAGKISMGINVVLYGLCMILFDVGTAVYSVILSVFCAFAMDRVHYQNIDQQITVLTKKYSEELRTEILEKMHRGITVLHGTGAYTGEDQLVLLITVSKYEAGKLKTLIKQHDPQAFIITNDRVRVSGNYKKHL